MNQRLTLISGIGLGAALMYVLDPEKGRRRRALVRDQVTHAIHKSRDAVDATARDVRNRARGLVADASSLFSREVVSDEVLVDRVRSKMGRAVSHPHAIQVTATEGRVTLSGAILESEVDDLLKCVAAVPGVAAVENHLGAHQRAGDIPDLQGGAARPGERSEWRQRNWSPTARLIAGAAGGALAIYGASRQDAIGATASALGIGLLVRGLTNLETKRLIGARGRRGIDLQKIVNINAPVEQVFENWTHYENFPHFMRNVREVRDLGDGRSHWTVTGPAGMSVEWEAEITKLVPNEILAWKSVPGAVIEHAGIIRFQSNDDGSTRVHIRMSYNPPAGAIGHVVAKLFGADPKKEMDEDMVRMKTLIETGKTPRDAAAKSPAAREARAQ